MTIVAKPPSVPTQQGAAPAPTVRARFARMRVPEPTRQPAPPRRDVRAGEVDEVVSLVSSAFFMISVLCLWFLAQLLFLSGASEARDQHLMYAQFRTELASETAPLGPTIAPGTPVALIAVPRLGAMQVVVEGTASGDLLAGPGHRRDTVLPGQQGLSLVYSRGSTYGAPFAGIGELHAGDQVIVTTAQGRKVLTVTDVRRAGDPVRPYPTGTRTRVSIVTTEGTGPMAGLRANSVVSVDAEAATGFAAPPGRATGVPAAEQPMGTDRTALPMLALALALLVGCTVAVSMARRRWSAALVWVVTTPVALALAWFTTDVVMRLLPNLM